MSDSANNSVTQETKQDFLVDLLDAIKGKDRDALATFYDATVYRILSLAIRITKQEVIAEEVVSDVYLQVWQQADNYSPNRGTVIAWLCILCRSRALDALRKDRKPYRNTADIMMVGLSEPKEPTDILQAVEQGSNIHNALLRLTEEQRQLIGLAYFRGYSHREIAEFMSMPMGTVKTHLHRAIFKLKEMMSSGVDLNGESYE